MKVLVIGYEVMRLTKLGFEVNNEFVVLISEVNKLSLQVLKIPAVVLEFELQRLPLS